MGSLIYLVFMCKRFLQGLQPTNLSIIRPLWALNDYIRMKLPSFIVQFLFHYKCFKNIFDVFMCTFVKHTLPKIIFFKFIKVKNLRTIDTYLSFQIAYSKVDHFFRILRFYENSPSLKKDLFIAISAFCFVLLTNLILRYRCHNKVKTTSAVARGILLIPSHQLFSFVELLGRNNYW